MPYGSAKQIAFFKRMAEKYNVAPCAGADIFDMEAYKQKHVKKLRALRTRKAEKKFLQKADKMAKRKGYKNFAAMKAAALATSEREVFGPPEHWKTRKKRLSKPAAGHTKRLGEKKRYEGPLNPGQAGREYYRG